ELAETALKAEPTVIWNVFTTALARCRLGQHEKAAALVRDYLKARSPGGLPVQDVTLMEFLAAIALARDGKADEARPFFEAACKRMDDVVQPMGQRRRANPGHAWAAAAALRREAEELLEERPR